MRSKCLVLPVTRMSLYLPLVNMTLPRFNGSCVGAAATQFLGYLHRGAVAAPVLVELGKRGVEHLVIHRCPSTGKVVDIWLLLFLGWRHNTHFFPFRKKNFTAMRTNLALSA